MDLHSAVGIETRYGLDFPRSESRWGRDFPHPFRLALGPAQLPIQRGVGSFLGVKRPGGDVGHPPASSAEVIERVELYLYSTSCPSWPVLGWTLPLSLPSVQFTSFYVSSVSFQFTLSRISGLCQSLFESSFLCKINIGIIFPFVSRSLQIFITILYVFLLTLTRATCLTIFMRVRLIILTLFAGVQI
jgi:hypothetical protein